MGLIPRSDDLTEVMVVGLDDLVRIAGDVVQLARSAKLLAGHRPYP
jgi:hypothetical protein